MRVPRAAGWAGKNIFVLDQVQPWASAGMKPEAPVDAARPAAKARPGIRIAARALSVDRPGPHVFRLRSLDGREVAVFRGEGPAEYVLPPARGGGVRFLISEPDGARWILPSL